MNQEARVAVRVLMSGVLIIDHSIPCCIIMERGDTDCGAAGAKTSCDQQKRKKKERTLKEERCYVTFVEDSSHEFQELSVYPQIKIR